jgi:RHS repeat-associated protein
MMELAQRRRNAGFAEVAKGASVCSRSSSLLSEYTDAGWKRDVIYLGSEAIAEIDAAGTHELHNDHLGTPRIVTKGNGTTAATIEGRQAYGPYGEMVQSQGYVPLAGYTGHIQTDATGLIYMRGRFYTPGWHRFVNSDQGVDPASWNQHAYAGGRPFHLKDPSGLAGTPEATVLIEDDMEWIETFLRESAQAHEWLNPLPGQGDADGGGGSNQNDALYKGFLKYSDCVERARNRVFRELRSIEQARQNKSRNNTLFGHLGNDNLDLNVAKYVGESVLNLATLGAGGVLETFVGPRSARAGGALGALYVGWNIGAPAAAPFSNWLSDESEINNATKKERDKAHLNLKRAEEDCAAAAIADSLGF